MHVTRVRDGRQGLGEVSRVDKLRHALEMVDEGLVMVAELTDEGMSLEADMVDESLVMVTELTDEGMSLES